MLFGHWQEYNKSAADQSAKDLRKFLDDQIGGQLDAGFVLTGFFEDVWPGQALSEYMPHYIATPARKP